MSNEKGKSRLVSNTEEQRETVGSQDGPELGQDLTPQQVRHQKAGLELQLAALKCRGCDSVGCWKITKKTNIVRYVKCTACGRTSAVPTSSPITKTLRPMDLAKLEEKSTT